MSFPIQDIAQRLQILAEGISGAGQRCFKRIPFLCVLFLFLGSGWCFAFQNEPAAGAVLLRVDGRVEIADSANRRLAPASLAKLALAVVVMESDPSRRNGVVRVSRAAARQTGSRLGLREGEKLKIDDLLAATLIASANDACYALAEHVGGSPQGAVKRMNKLAKRLGMVATLFKDPCGHDHPAQTTTARDLMLLADAAMRYQSILEFAGTREMRITTADGRWHFSLKTTNLLLGRYPGLVGLKTGYTARAGQCLIALARQDGVEVLLILLAADDRWERTIRLLDAGFERARSQPSREVSFH
jgi:D-alanyl-D-alanine carboxypeptidase (penicillin-binding protein 5/6)